MKNCMYQCTECGNCFELPNFGKTITALCYSSGKKATMVKITRAKLIVKPQPKLVN